MEKELNEDRLGKIIELAKKGVGGERENAIRLVHKLCDKHGLNFDEVMSEGEKIKEFLIECQKSEAELLAQTVFKYGIPNKKCSVWGIRSGRGIRFEGTQTTYIETLNAWAVLSRLYRKEKKRVDEAMFQAFIDKHDLFYQLKPGENRPKRKPPTKHDIEVGRMAMGIGMNLEDAEIHKTLDRGIISS